MNTAGLSSTGAGAASAARVARIARLVGGGLVLAALVALLPEFWGPGPRADFALAERLAGGQIALPLALAFLGGLLTALTPCVYPLIPITVSVFGARQAQSRARALGLTSTYVLGLALLFTSLGIGAAFTGRAFGSALGEPIVVIGLALVFAALAASMFGAFDLQLPSALQTRLGTVGRAGYGGAFAMGLVAGLVAAPCTGPVLSGILVHVATTQSVGLGAALLFAFSLGLGVPFFLIGAFSVRLPKSGAWMDAVKSLFGIALLALAMSSLRDAFPAIRVASSLHGVAYGAVVAGGLVFAGVVIGAIHRGFHAWPTDGVLKALGVMLVVAGISMRPGAPLAEPRAVSSAWRTSEPEAIALARASGAPVLIDFFAEWCAACKELDAYVYTDPDFLEDAQRFVLVKIDGTRETPEIERLYSKYGVRGLPTVIFIDGKGEVRTEATLTGYLHPRAFVERMKAVR